LLSSTRFAYSTINCRVISSPYTSANGVFCFLRASGSEGQHTVKPPNTSHIVSIPWALGRNTNTSLTQVQGVNMSILTPLMFANNRGPAPSPWPCDEKMCGSLSRLHRWHSTAFSIRASQHQFFPHTRMLSSRIPSHSQGSGEGEDMSVLRGADDCVPITRCAKAGHLTHLTPEIAN
jgi:hypothetical protein